MRIIVEDNGEELTDEALQQIDSRTDRIQRLQETTGIVNIHRRIVITFGEGQRFASDA